MSDQLAMLRGHEEYLRAFISGSGDPHREELHDSLTALCQAAARLQGDPGLREASEPDLAALREALAEGLHKAMCFGPTMLHNRLACERPQVYLALAEAALAHPAMVEVLGVSHRSTEAAFGAFAALGDDLDAALRDGPRLRRMLTDAGCTCWALAEDGYHAPACPLLRNRSREDDR